MRRRDLDSAKPKAYFKLKRKESKLQESGTLSSETNPSGVKTQEKKPLRIPGLPISISNLMAITNANSSTTRPTQISEILILQPH